MFKGVAAHGITWFNAGRVKENWKPVETIFAEMKEAGYDGVEYDNRMPSTRSALELKKMAADCGLQWVGQSVSPPAKEGDAAGWEAFRQKVDLAVTLGVKVATTGMGGRPKAAEQRQERFKRTADVLEKAASICRGAGIALAAHNHWGQMLENRSEIDTLMELAPSLGLLFDTAHLELCGGGVMEVIHEHGGRIAHVHLKDLDTRQPLVADNRLGQPRQWPNFKELGKGGLDFARILGALRDSGYAGWISVELDWADRDPLEAHKANRARLRQLGY